MTRDEPHADGDESAAPNTGAGLVPALNAAMAVSGMGDRQEHKGPLTRGRGPSASPRGEAAEHNSEREWMGCLHPGLRSATVPADLRPGLWSGAPLGLKHKSRGPECHHVFLQAADVGKHDRATCSSPALRCGATWRRGRRRFSGVAYIEGHVGATRRLDGSRHHHEPGWRRHWGLCLRHAFVMKIPAARHLGRRHARQCLRHPSIRDGGSHVERSLMFGRESVDISMGARDVEGRSGSVTTYIGSSGGKHERI